MKKIIKKIAKKIGLTQVVKTRLALDYTNQNASDFIQSKLEENKPLMISRFGSVELDCLLNYLEIKRNEIKILKYLKFKFSNQSTHFYWSGNTLATMKNNAGFFPSEPKALESFSKAMIESIKSIDILGSWYPGENIVRDYLSKAKVVNLCDLEPYYHKQPWTVALENKKVLVIHPFAETIKKQYAKRETLFSNPDILPVFELHTLKSVQSIAGNSCDFNSWFEALQYMKNRINEIEFDIAIIGCGAYGMFLASHIKDMGKIAIHLGGATQILFGIKGKRWDNHPTISKLFNQFWVRPDISEMPANAENVENGCYW